jgi:tRNA(fMet)-specific endonuclease VapC
MDSAAVLIDTSIFIEHFRARDKAGTPLTRIHQARHMLVTSSIVAAELCYGARSATARADVMTLLSMTRVIPFPESVALRISFEVERLKVKNAVTGFRDLAIACVAMEERLPLATHNHREFSRVEGLQLFDLTTV